MSRKQIWREIRMFLRRLKKAQLSCSQIATAALHLACVAGTSISESLRGVKQ